MENNQNKKEEIIILSSQHERPESWPSIKEAPKTEEEFYEIVNNASWPQLKEYGFGKWSTMNEVIQDNIKYKDESNMISIPTIDGSDLDNVADQIANVVNGNPAEFTGSMIFELSSKESRPMELLKEDEDIILFPGGWYDIIPDGFKCTGIHGQEEIFVKGESDDDTRFGCLAYGIRRKLLKQTTD
jgi:hypothetical protein